MKAQEVLTQLVGELTGDEFIAYDVDGISSNEFKQYPGKLVEVCFETGIVNIHTDEGGETIEKSFAIKATLEPLDP